MESKKAFIITVIVQTVYLLFIAMVFLCIWMFTVGVAYTYPFAILGIMFIFFCPIDLFCFISNLFFVIKDIKASFEHRQIVIRTIFACIFFVLFCAIKIGLFHYGDVLVGVA